MKYLEECLALSKDMFLNIIIITITRSGGIDTYHTMKTDENRQQRFGNWGFCTAGKAGGWGGGLDLFLSLLPFVRSNGWKCVLYCF